ncbi:MmcQ/YjbR family DNA-binding protein [Mycolicibacterium sp. 018/SC-01/001]|uniref:MmcQ/YjbR family DNA-binding protein n=1 Tax=Mycolicibacterium sp. 018/SC-01/001 TaxID=2592069 RepID=UPI00117E20F4|nr:MmcQ/YjbR family DNA-binding protein [Mycolicibacterium sp. 018/SC-01/001]TRW76959.1 MmcQ/YjbR family DNA-binding protein [Mycolicibacterium sp. 018/SC-01/001]
MSSLDQARDIALGLPEAVEVDHHGIASFRVRGKIFATVPDDRHIRIMLDENGIRSAVAEFPAVCDEFYWGTKLSCVVVTVTDATTGLLRELLEDAYRRKAPASLVRRIDQVEREH